MSTLESISQVRQLLMRIDSIEFTEHLGFTRMQFVCKSKHGWFRESVIKQFKSIPKVNCDLNNLAHTLVITIPLECKAIKLEDKYSPEVLKDKLKAIKRVKPLAKAPDKKKFPKYVPHMSMQAYYALYQRLNPNMTLLSLASDMGHSTALYEGDKVDFDTVFELVSDI